MATFIFHSDWLENIKGLPLDEQDKVIADIVRYGTGCDLRYGDEAHVAALVNMVKDRIDFSKDKYEKKSFGGSKKKVDDAAIKELAEQGKTAVEIAEILGISKSAVDHSEGWKMRYKNLF